MRTTVLVLASAIALCLVLPYCCARPGEVVVKKSDSQKASASASVEQESSEQIVKKGGCGCGGGGSLVASKKKSSKAAAASSASSSSSYEAKKVESGGCKTLTEAQIKEKYIKKSSESDLEYFKRITSKSYSWTSTTESYIKTLSVLRKSYCDLPLWYDTKYYDLVKDYYFNYYAKQETESWESYYSRIVTKESWESDEQYAKRVILTRDCYPNLDLWTSDKWSKKFLYKLYGSIYKKCEKESEKQWLDRIFARDAHFDTSDKIYAERVYRILESTFTSCESLWYSKKYFSYYKKFYEIYYKKQEGESYDNWLLRVIAPLPNENFDNAITRIKYVHEITGNYGCWKIDYFKQIQKANKLKKEWLDKVQKAFFPCGCGGGTIEKSSSKKSSASATATASQSSESSKVVKSG